MTVLLRMSCSWLSMGVKGLSTAFSRAASQARSVSNNLALGSAWRWGYVSQDVPLVWSRFGR